MDSVPCQKNGVFMMRRLPYLMLMLFLAVLGAWAQNTKPNPPKPDHDKSPKPSRYSAALPKGEFQDNQN